MKFVLFWEIGDLTKDIKKFWRQETNIKIKKDLISGRYQVVSAISANSGEYMFTVGNRHLVRKSFGRVTVLTKQGT